MDTNPGLCAIGDNLGDDLTARARLGAFELSSSQDRSEDIASPSQALRIWLGLEAPSNEGQLSIDALLSDLFSSRWTTRVSAVRMLEALGRHSSPRVVRALAKALDDNSEFVRAAAAEALGRLEAQSVRTRLVLAVGDPAWSVRVATVQALGRLGRNVPVETLLGLIGEEGDPDSSVRGAAVSALGKLRRPDLLVSLARVLKDSDPFVRLAAVQALGEQRECLPVEALLPALNDEDEDVRLAALEALGGRTPVEALLRALEDGSEEVRLAALGLLGGMGEHTPLERLILTLKDQDERIRNEAVKILGRFADQIVRRVSSEFLSDLLRDEEAHLRALAVWVFGERKDERVKQPLLDAVGDPHEMVRSAAIWALQALGIDYDQYSSLQGTSEDAQLLPPGMHVRLGGEFEKQTAMARFLSALVEYFGDKRGYVHPELKETSSGRVLVVRCYCQSGGSSLQETVLNKVAHHASVSQLDAALNSGDDLVRGVTSQIMERLDAGNRPWHELFVVSLSLLRDANEQLSADLPTRVVLCSASVHNVRASDGPVLGQIITTFERSSVCVSSQGNEVKARKNSGSLPASRDHFFEGKVSDGSGRSGRSRLGADLEDFQIWYGYPSGLLGRWGAQRVSYRS